MTVKPITPDEALGPADNSVPECLVEALNALLREGGGAGSQRVVLTQAKVLDAAMARAPEGASRLAVRAALARVPALYATTGWAVTVDPQRGDADSYVVFARAARPTPPPSVVRREGDAP
jgi:hypothetical protein